MADDRVLIVEDDPEIAKVVAMNLTDIGLTPHIASDGETGLREALTGAYAVIILDLMLPGLDGVSVCSRLREHDPRVPVLMLTAKADEIDRVMGLELGADDYMTKPFSVRELAARVRALLRRSRTAPANAASDERASIGSISIDFGKRKAMVGDRDIALTAKEFDLLGLFVRNPGRAYSRADLLEQVWGYSFEGYEHTVNTHINRLRGKIEPDPSKPVYLQTVWGVGYRFAEAEELDS
jgi:DNA-binding response OmpR family regulator